MTLPTDFWLQVALDVPFLLLADWWGLRCGRREKP